MMGSAMQGSNYIWLDHQVVRTIDNAVEALDWRSAEECRALAEWTRRISGKLCEGELRDGKSLVPSSGGFAGLISDLQALLPLLPPRVPVPR